MKNSAGLTICIARRLAQAEKQPQQAAMIQTAARLLSDADSKTKDELMRFIALTPQERQASLSVTEALLIGVRK